MKTTNTIKNFAKRVVMMMTAILMVSNVWGADTNWSWTATSGALGTTSPNTVTLNGKSWTVTRSSVVYTGWSSNCIQLGSSSGAETVTLSSSAFPGTIKSVYIECSSYNNAHKVSITVGGNTYLASTATAKWTTVSSKGGTGTSSGEIVITLTKGSRAVYIKSISVTYEEVSCSSNPTVTAGSNSSVTSTTATVSCSSGISLLGSAGCSITSYGFVIGTSSNPSIGGSGVTKHEVGTSYTTTGTSFSKNLTGLSASTTYYVRPYATNGNGTAYGTQTSFTTLALPKYTVTYNAGTGSCKGSDTEASGGAGVTLPTPTHSCSGDGWSFAGWTTGSLVTSATTTAPATLYSGGSVYHPTGDITLYAVYMKAGDGLYHLVTTLPTGDDIPGQYMIVNTASLKAMDVDTKSTYYLDADDISSITSNSINPSNVTYFNYNHWIVTYENSKWIFYNATREKYLYNYCNDGTHHNVGNTSTKPNGYSIELSSGYAVFTSADDVGAHIWYDASHTDFAGTTGSTNNLHLYKEEATIYHSTPSCSSTYTVSYAAGGASGTVPTSHTEISSGSSITLKSPDNLTAPAGKQFAGWNDGSNTYASGASYTVTGNKTMTAQWECITPSISVHPSNGSCVQGGSPSALTVTASGGTLSYQWKQCATANGTYTNASGGSGATTASYTPPVSSVGTMYYKCVVTNTGSSCGTTATSNYASFEVTAPASKTYYEWNGSNAFTTSSGGATLKTVPSLCDWAIEPYGWCSEENYASSTYPTDKIWFKDASWPAGKTDLYALYRVGSSPYYYSTKPTIYTITYTLTNVTKDDSYTYVCTSDIVNQVGTNNFEAYFKPNTGYYLDNSCISVTMGGSPVSSSNYSWNPNYSYAGYDYTAELYMENITGNVVVTVTGKTCTQLPAPTGLSVAENVDATHGKTTFSWNAVAGASGYVLTVTQNGSTTNTYDRTSGQLSKTGTLPAGNYTWSVKAKGDGSTYCEEGTSANGSSFCVGADLSAITPSGLTISNVTSTSARFSWSAVANAAKYKVTVKTGGSPIVGFDNQETTNTYMDVTGLTAGTTYTAEVTAYNACEDSYKSNTASTTILIRTVTFNSNGGSAVAAAYVNSGSTVSQPSNPTKDGYDFSKWQLSGADYNFSSAVTSNITLDAVWSAKTYTVTLNKNGGSGGPASVTATYAAAAPSVGTLPTLSGKNFGGYWTGEGGTGTMVVDNSGVWVASISGFTDASKNWIGTTNKTIYAKWNDKTYSNYRTTCGAAKTLDYITITTPPTTVNYLTGQSFSSAGAAVEAYYTDDTHTTVTASVSWTPPATPLAAGAPQTVVASYTEGGITKTANQTINVYTPTVLKKDETGATISGLLSDAPAVSCTVNVLAADETGNKHRFKEWQISGGTLGSSADTRSNTIATVSGAITVTAVYYKPITVTWHVNGSVYGTPGEYLRPWNTIYPADPTPVSVGCEGKVFIGWSRTEDYRNDDTAPTDMVSSGDALTSNEHFYAVFADKESNGTAPEWTVKSYSSIDEGTYLICLNNKKVFNGSTTSGIGGVTGGAFSHALSGTFNEDAPVGACELTLTSSGGGFKMYNATYGYLYCTKAGSGALAWTASDDEYWFYNSSYWKYHGQKNGSGVYVGLHDYGSDIRTYVTPSSGVVFLKKTAAGVPAVYSDYTTSCTCKAYSFHTGSGTDEAVKTTNTRTCFEQVESSTTWQIEDYVIPSDAKFFVGYQDEFKTSGLGTSSRSSVQTWSAEMYFEYSKNYGDGWRKTVGAATGAVGTLRIWSDNSWNNCHVGFDPNGYVFKLGSTNIEMHNATSGLDGAQYKETDVITLTSTDISGNFQVNLYTGSAGGVASDNSVSRAMTTMGVKSGSGDNWRGSSINAGTDANTKGFFRIDLASTHTDTKNWNAHWVPCWELTFDLKGGTGTIATTPAYVSVEAASKQVTIPNTVPTKSGYRFLGWSNTDGGAVNYAAGSTHNVTLSGNKTVYAVWAQEFTVTYAANGGTTSCSEPNHIAGEVVTVCATEPTKACSTFTGWLGDNSIGTKAASSTFTMPAANVTLTAQWNTTQYVITYKDQGNVPYSGSNSGSLPANHTCGEATVLPDGERAGYRFDGWFTTSACTGEPISSIAGGEVGPFTLYAKWTASHTFTFKDYENTTVATIGQIEGGNVVMPNTTADCGLWTTFEGWVIGSVAETTTEPATIYRPGDIYVAGSSDQEFKALYSKHEGDASVTYVQVTSNSPMPSGEYVIACPSGNTIMTGLNGNKRGTYEAVSISDGVISNKGNGVVVNINKKGSLFNIKMSGDTKYITSCGETYFGYSETDGATACTWELTNEGYIHSTNNTTRYIEFLKSGTQYFGTYEGTQWKSFLFRKKVAGTTYYATNPASCIVPTQVVVSYNDNKSHAGDQTISGMPSGTTLTFDPYPNFASYTVGSAPTDPTGYHFAGWNTSADGSGSDYAAGASVTTFGYVENVTLYAKWERVYSVTLYDNGVERTTLTEASGGAGVTLPSGNNCTPGSAFTFVGWTESAIVLNADPVRPASATLHAAGVWEPTSDITLYSVYSRSVAGCEDFASGVSGAYKMYNNTSGDYAKVTANSNRYDKGSSGDAEIFYIAYAPAHTAYTIRTSLGYLGWEGAVGSENLTKTNTTPYYWNITTNGTNWNFQPVGVSGKQFSGNGTYFNLHSNSTKYYIRLEKVAMTYYYNTAICGDASITFHDGGGTISGTPTTPDGSSWSNPVLSGLENCDKITTFPTASYDGWTFVGWSTEDYTNCGKHTAGTSQYAAENASTDEPDASIIYKTDGNPYVVRGGSIDLYPIFTRFPDNEPFDLENGGTFYMYYLDESSDDGYGAPQRRYAGPWDGTKRYTAVTNCANATAFTFTKSGAVWHIQNGDKYVGGLTGNSDWLVEKSSLGEDGALTDWTISIRSGNQFNANCQSLRQIGVFGSHFMDYTTNDINTNPGYNCVYLGSCEERIFSSEPNPVPTIDLIGSPMVTSSAGERVRATATMTLSGSHLASVPANKVKVSGTNLKFAKDATTNPADYVMVDVDGSGNASATIYVYYTPAVGDTEDGIENIIVTAQAFNSSQAKDVQTTGVVQVRHLPADFVIAAKWDGKWYALPNTCAGEGSNTAGVLISVDDDDDPTVATAAPHTAKWGLRQTKAGSRTDGSYNDRLVFTERTTAEANSQKTLYNYNKAEVFTNATYTNYNNTNPERYEWIPVTSDFGDYELTNANDASHHLILRNSDGLFVAQNSDKAYDGKVRLLPATFYEEAPVQILEWKANSVVVMYTGTETTATTQIEGNSATSAQTLASQKLTHGIYELTTSASIGKGSNSCKNLTLAFGSTEKVFEIPVILTGGVTSFSGYEKKDIIIPKNIRLQASTSTKYNYRNIYVYGGGKLDIPANGKLGVNNIILRAGGISTDGHGGSATYEYVYPQVKLASTEDFTSTKTNIKFEYITDYSHWYHLCLPFNGTLNSITYPVEYYGTNVAADNHGSWQIKRYDGATRATGDYNAWVDIETESATQVIAGKGYIYWGAPKKLTIGGVTDRSAWGIQRITMQVTAAAAISAEIADKTVDGLGSYSGVDGNSGKVNDQGWNLIGNPYMTNLTGLNSTSLKTGKLIEEMVNDKWTGHWVDNEDGIRYVTVPSDHFDTYTAQTMAWFTSENPMKPGRTFFIQIDGDATGVTFATANRASLMPAWERKAEAEQTVDIETGIVLSNDEGDEVVTDEVNFWLKDGKTEAYEYNADYPKTPNKTNFNIYGVHEHGNLSWVAVSPDIAKGSMAIGYQVPAPGDYTLSLSETYLSDEIEAVYVTDHEITPEYTIDLKDDTYSFRVNQAEINDTRFTVSIKLKDEQQVPTDIGNVQSDESEHPLKFLYKEKMYILRNGVLYDATGKRVSIINR